jgi:hypothetical protein
MGGSLLRPKREEESFFLNHIARPNSDRAEGRAVIGTKKKKQKKLY